jgi:mannose-6-phosphate isomerase-like protein (cupin superfamily)
MISGFDPGGRLHYKSIHQFMKAPIIFKGNIKSAIGSSFVIHEWQGSGPAYLHVHHADDEAWYVLEGTVHFRFQDSHYEAHAGTTVFVPAGVPHTYSADDSTRYLIILTERLDQLITALHQAPLAKHPEIMKEYQSEICATPATPP